jgi:hypothetical protein
MNAMFGLLKADEDGGQGEGHLAEYLRLSFHRTIEFFDRHLDGC